MVNARQEVRCLRKAICKRTKKNSSVQFFAGRKERPPSLHLANSTMTQSHRSPAARRAVVTFVLPFTLTAVAFGMNSPQARPNAPSGPGGVSVGGGVLAKKSLVITQGTPNVGLAPSRPIGTAESKPAVPAPTGSGPSSQPAHNSSSSSPDRR